EGLGAGVQQADLVAAGDIRRRDTPQTPRKGRSSRRQGLYALRVGHACKLGKRERGTGNGQIAAAAIGKVKGARERIVPPRPFLLPRFRGWGLPVPCSSF